MSGWRVEIVESNTVTWQGKMYEWQRKTRSSKTKLSCAEMLKWEGTALLYVEDLWQILFQGGSLYYLACSWSTHIRTTSLVFNCRTCGCSAWWCNNLPMPCSNTLNDMCAKLHVGCWLLIFFNRGLSKDTGCMPLSMFLLTSQAKRPLQPQIVSKMAPQWRFSAMVGYSISQTWCIVCLPNVGGGQHIIGICTCCHSLRWKSQYPGYGWDYYSDFLRRYQLLWTTLLKLLWLQE